MNVAGGFLPPVVLELFANITEFKAKMAEAGVILEELEVAGATSNARMAAAARMGFMAAGAAAVGIAAFSVHAAQQNENALAKLRVAIKSTGASLEEVMPYVEQLGEKFLNLGYDEAKTNEAFARLTTATNSPRTAMQLMSDAANLARYKHMDLTAAAVALGRATQGQARIFTEMGISMDTTLPKQERFQKALEQLRQKIGGQAAAYADTFAGKLEIFGGKAENLAEKLGNLLLPVLTQIADALAKGVDFLSRYGAQILWVAGISATLFGIYKVGVVVLGAYRTVMGMVAVQQALAAASQVTLTTAQGLGTVATMGLTTAMNALKAAFLSNPIGLIAMALVALVAALVYAMNHWEGFRKAVAAVVGWVIEHMADLVDKVVGAFKFIVDAVMGYGDKYLSIMENVFGWVPGLGDGIKEAHRMLNGVWTSIGNGMDAFGDTLRAKGKEIGASASASIIDAFKEKGDEELDPNKVPKGYGLPAETAVASAGKAIDKMLEHFKESSAAMALFASQFKKSQQDVDGNIELMMKLAEAAKKKAEAFMAAARADVAKTKGTKNHAAALKELAQATNLATAAQKYQNDVMELARRSAEEAARAMDAMTNSYARNNSYLASISRLSGSDQRASYIEVPVIIDGQVLFRVNQKASLVNNRRNSTNGLARSGSVI